MAILSKIKAVLSLSTDDYKKGLKDAEKQTQGFGKTIGKVGGLIAAAFSVQQIGRFAIKMAELDHQMQNVGRAFQRLGDPELLEDLRRSTGGMVSDLELMKNAVQAVNLGLQQGNLATYFEFASVRAAETGESVDYLVNSIVTGIGRKSPLILDNLGLSITDIQEEFKKTGDFALAASNIIQREMDAANTSIEDVVSSTATMAANWDNFLTNLAQEHGPFINALIRLAAEATKIGDSGNVKLKNAYGELSTKALEILSQEELRKLLEAENKLKDEMYQEWLDARGKWWEFEMDSEYDVAKENIEKIEALLQGLEQKGSINIQIAAPVTSMTSTGMETFGDPEKLKEGIVLLNEHNAMLADASSGYYKLAGAAELYNAKLPDMTANMEDLNAKFIRMNELLATVAGAAIGSFTDALMQAIESGDVVGAFAGFLKDLGGMMAKYGASLVAFGIAQKVLATSADPYSKIAAGAVLIASGIALGAIGKGISKGSSSGSFSGYSGGGGYGSYGGGTFGSGGGYTSQREIVLVARGNDLVAVLNAQDYEDNMINP